MPEALEDPPRQPVLAILVCSYAHHSPCCNLVTSCTAKGLAPQLPAFSLSLPHAYHCTTRLRETSLLRTFHTCTSLSAATVILFNCDHS
eukprot:scaffold157041_cov15-Tisochrysis_lutea.AAC.1